jgi:hypothetical protein
MAKQEASANSIQNSAQPNPKKLLFILMSRKKLLYETTFKKIQYFQKLLILFNS